MSRNLEIYERRKAGASVTALAREYGLCKSRISAICKEVSELEADGADMPQRLASARLELAAARAENEAMKLKQMEIRLKVARGELMRKDEITDVFQRVFSPYRQAVKEISRRYGPDAGRLVSDLVNAELKRADAARAERLAAMADSKV